MERGLECWESWWILKFRGVDVNSCTMEHFVGVKYSQPDWNTMGRRQQVAVSVIYSKRFDVTPDLPTARRGSE